MLGLQKESKSIQYSRRGEPWWGVPWVFVFLVLFVCSSLVLALIFARWDWLIFARWG